MNLDGIETKLESFWSDESGVFWLLREGVFAVDKIEEVVFVLRAIDLGSDEFVSRRMVSMLWYMPTFMSWQQERVVENGGDADVYDRAMNSVLDEIQRILGVP
jgi:hypothetical protein